VLGLRFWSPSPSPPAAAVALEEASMGRGGEESRGGGKLNSGNVKQCQAHAHGWIAICERVGSSGSGRWFKT
jgi:hypothetical protein